MTANKQLDVKNTRKNIHELNIGELSGVEL